MEEVYKIIHTVSDKDLAALEEYIRAEWAARWEKELFK